MTQREEIDYIDERVMKLQDQLNKLQDQVNKFQNIEMKIFLGTISDQNIGISARQHDLYHCLQKILEKLNEKNKKHA